MTCPEVSCPSSGQGSGYIVPPVQTTLATTRHADQLQTGLDISSREGDVQKYFENGLVPSTRRTYQGGINKFVKFCGLYNIINPLPVSQSLLCSYTSHLDNSGLVYGTIKKKTPLAGPQTSIPCCLASPMFTHGQAMWKGRVNVQHRHQN